MAQRQEVIQLRPERVNRLNALNSLPAARFDEVKMEFSFGDDEDEDEKKSETQNQDLTFQIIDIRVENKPVPTIDVSQWSLLFMDETYAGQDDGRNKLAIVYLFGVTQTGQSVCAGVKGFRPWCYIELTAMVNRTQLASIITEITAALYLPSGSITMTPVSKKKVFGWVPASATDPSEVATFSFAYVEFPVTSALRDLDQIIECHNLTWKPGSAMSFDDADKKKRALGLLKKCPSLKRLRENVVVSETRVQASEKFLVSRRLTPSSWVTLANGAFEDVPLDTRATVSQFEVSCHVNALNASPLDCIAPLLIAAVDIEVQSSDYRSFPDANIVGDKCTFIGTTFWVYGDKEPRLRVMQVLGACNDVDGTMVESFDSEENLLVGWRDLIALRTNPDMIVSYNGTGFDFAYLWKRHELIARSNPPRYSRFAHLSRFLSLKRNLEKREVSSAGMGQNEISEFPMLGRVQLDLFQYIKTSQKLSSYKLDDVAKQFLSGDSSAKIVLDYKGWVSELAGTAATCLLDTVASILTESDSVTANALYSSLNDILDNVSISTVELDRTEVVVQENECTNADDDEEDASETKSKWSRVNKLLESAVDVFGKIVEIVGALKVEAERQSFRASMRDLLDCHVQPALDASGDDNYRKLFRMYDGSAAHRAQIVHYCRVDCDLVVYLLDRLNVLPNTVQMSQVTYTLLNDIFSRGQQIKTFNLIARHSFLGGYVMNFEDIGWDPNAEYEGATVLPPVTGYYQRPVITLDFASLYPSIMRAYNLCFSSLVLDDKYAHMEEFGARYGRYEFAGKVWTFQEHQKGLLPKILEFLVEERKASKKDMKKYPKGSLDYKLADGKQLALKVSCNSVYGFTGALNHGMFPCMPVAVATTFNGRQLIQQTKRFMETQYAATVIYGDTDSVMLQFPNVNTVPEAFALGGRVAKECTATFRDVLSLEFEKVYCPYLLIRKKHYAGMKYEDNPSHVPTLDAKGLALVRRDNCQLVRTTMRDVLNATMRDANPTKAYEIVRDAIKQLVAGQVPTKDLEISNFLRKDLQNDHHPHIQVMKNMIARHAFGVPRVGDRVPYVIVEGARNSQIYQRAEHPKYVEEHKIKLDREYYLRNQLQSRLEKVLTPLPIPSVFELFEEASREIMRSRQGLQRLDLFFPLIGNGDADSDANGDANHVAKKMKVQDGNAGNANAGNANARNANAGTAAPKVTKQLIFSNGKLVEKPANVVMVKTKKKPSRKQEVDKNTKITSFFS